MATLETELERISLEASLKPCTGFTGAVRSLENAGLELNDVIVVPDNYVFEGEGRNTFVQTFGTNDVPFVICKLDGTDQVKRFFPSTFTKRRRVYDDNKQPTAKFVWTLGTAAEKYRSFTSVKDAMEALKGKKIKVTKLETFKTMRYDRPELMDCQILTLDFID